MTTEHEQDEFNETEGETLAKEAGTDSPFDGTGRPFSDDNLNMSEFYYHDNPATNVGPYAGPSSYSINTVAPYAPPHQGEENPAQNAGPYRPPGYAPETTDGDFDEDDLPANVGKGDTDADADRLSHAYSRWNDAQWFDGTSKSIYSRAIEAEQIRRQAHAAGAFDLEDELSEQIEVLNKTAAEFDDSSLHEFMDEVPGGTVALEYDDLVDGGLVDITSFLSVGAHAVAKESAEYDWASFKEEGARQWITQKIADNPGLLKHEVMARTAAIDYAKDKTMVLMDPVFRADIIDDFVTNVERFRREAANRLFEDEESRVERRRQFDALRMAQATADVAETYEEYLPGEYTDLEPDFDEDGYLNIGEPDGTYLYDEAARTIEAAKRNWEDFTTEGARDWFFGKATDSPLMLKHADITRRAAKKFAGEQVALVPDEALKTEVVRAFTESVEFLRQVHAHREGFRREAAVDSSFEDIYAEEDEILW